MGYIFLLFFFFLHNSQLFDLQGIFASRDPHSYHPLCAPVVRRGLVAPAACVCVCVCVCVRLDLVTRWSQVISESLTAGWKAGPDADDLAASNQAVNG